MTKSEHIAEIRRLEQERDSITDEIWEEAKKAFGIGDTVFFEKWGTEISAEIPDISGPHYPRFFIRSHTGKKYWIDLYHLLKT